MNKGLQCVSALESSGIFDLARERKVAQSRQKDRCEALSLLVITVMVSN